MLWTKVVDLLHRRYQVVKKGTVALSSLMKRKIDTGSTKI